MNTSTITKRDIQILSVIHESVEQDGDSFIVGCGHAESMGVLNLVDKGLLYRTSNPRYPGCVDLTVTKRGKELCSSSLFIQ